jgi:MarR family transcriptional regulator, transcriptional regulator for hemolysin
MTAAPAPPQVDLAFLLAQASHALNARLAGRLAELGITPRDHCVLAKAAGGEYTQGQLAEKAALDKTTMVVTLDGLEAAGLAERRASATDRRARIVAVTERGGELAERSQRIVDDTFAEMLDMLPDDVRDGFVAGLTTLVEGPLAAPLHTAFPTRRPRSSRQA